jgi:hypothetical protein
MRWLREFASLLQYMPFEPAAAGIGENVVQNTSLSVEMQIKFVATRKFFGPREALLSRPDFPKWNRRAKPATIQKQKRHSPD